MEFQYYIVYLIVNIVCFFFALTILVRISSDIGSDVENKMFRMMLLLYMAFLVCEVIWVLGEGNFLPISPYATSVIKIVGTVFIPIKVYFWFQYAEMKFGNPMAFTKKFRIVTFIPAAIMLLIYISNPATGLIATVNPDGSVINGPLIALTGIIDNIYGIAIIIHAIILTFKNKSKAMRRVYFVHCMFIIICTIGGIADAVISGTPIMPLAIMLSLHVLFINLQESKIFNDAVTGLNNRKSADNYLAELIPDTSEKTPFHMVMMSIDDLMTINERYGQVEGDRALRLASDSMRRAIAKHDGFLARWGGNEFMAIIRSGDPGAVDTFKRDLDANLERAAIDNSLPYAITYCEGHDMCSNKEMDPTDLIARADRNLRQARAEKGIEKGEWIKL